MSKSYNKNLSLSSPNLNIFNNFVIFSEKMLHFKILIFSKNVTNLKLYCSVSFFCNFQRKCYNIFAFWLEREVNPWN